MHEPPRLRPVGSVPGASRRGECEGGSRWPARQLARGIPTTTTARRCLSYGTADGWTVFHVGPPARPSQVARASPFARDASATTAARLVSFDLFRLPCITLRRLLRLRPLRSIPVGYTVQTAETGQDNGGRPGQVNQASADPGTSFPGSPTARRQKTAVRQVAVRKAPRRCAPRAARNVVILRFSLIALGRSREKENRQLPAPARSFHQARELL